MGAPNLFLAPGAIWSRYAPARTIWKCAAGKSVCSFWWKCCSRCLWFIYAF